VSNGSGKLKTIHIAISTIARLALSRFLAGDKEILSII
jgi:hypothetical protein